MRQAVSATEASREGRCAHDRRAGRPPRTERPEAGRVYELHSNTGEVKQGRAKVAAGARAMWVPNLRLSRAAALAVRLGQPYYEAIRDKLVGLLERAGKRRARAAVQAYL